MTQEKVVEILNDLSKKVGGEGTAEALIVASRCVKFIGSMCKVLEGCREEKEIDVARAYIEGFKIGVFKE